MGVVHYEVSPDQQFREWLDRVRGLVGARLWRVPWSKAREVVGMQRLRLIWETCPDIKATASLIVEGWHQDLRPSN